MMLLSSGLDRPTCRPTSRPKRSAGCGDRAFMAVPHPQLGGGGLDRWTDPLGYPVQLSNFPGLEYGSQGHRPEKPQPASRAWAGAQSYTRPPSGLARVFWGPGRPSAHRVTPGNRLPGTVRPGRIGAFIHVQECMESPRMVDGMQGNTDSACFIIDAYGLSGSGINASQGYIWCVIKTMTLGDSHFVAHKSSHQFLSEGAR